MKNILKVKQILLVPSIGSDHSGITRNDESQLAINLRKIFINKQIDLVIYPDEINARQTAQMLFEDVTLEEAETAKLSLKPHAKDVRGIHEYELIHSKMKFHEESGVIHFSEILLTSANTYMLEKANQAMLACKTFTDVMVRQSGSIVIIAEPIMLHAFIELLHEEGDENKDQIIIEPGEYFEITYDQMYLDLTEVRKRNSLQRV